MVGYIPHFNITTDSLGNKYVRVEPIKGEYLKGIIYDILFEKESNVVTYFMELNH